MKASLSIPTTPLVNCWAGLMGRPMPKETAYICFDKTRSNACEDLGSQMLRGFFAKSLNGGTLRVSYVVATLRAANQCKPTNSHPVMRSEPPQDLPVQRSGKPED